MNKFLTTKESTWQLMSSVASRQLSTNLHNMRRGTKFGAFEATYTEGFGMHPHLSWRSYHRRAIESVLAQSLADFELIVIGDGSPDNTRAIVERFTDPRLIYLHNARNLGPQGNWNRCLEVTQGTYFKLLPHDATVPALSGESIYRV